MVCFSQILATNTTIYRSLLSLNLKYQRKADVDATSGSLELPTSFVRFRIGLWRFSVSFRFGSPVIIFANVYWGQSYEIVPKTPNFVSIISHLHASASILRDAEINKPTISLLCLRTCRIPPNFVEWPDYGGFNISRNTHLPPPMINRVFFVFEGGDLGDADKSLTPINTPKTLVFARVTKLHTIFGHYVSQKSCTFCTGYTSSLPKGGRGGEALVSGRNSMLFTPKLNAFHPKTHSFPNCNPMSGDLRCSFGTEKTKNQEP